MKSSQPITRNYDSVCNNDSINNNLKKDLESHFIEFIAYWNEFNISREAFNLRRANDLKSEMDKRTAIILDMIAKN